MDDQSLKDKLAQYKFYQTIDLGNGIKTPGFPLAQKQKEVLSLIEQMDLRGKRVADLGCANGLFALAAEKRGGQEVLAIDHTSQNIESLNEIIIPHLQSNVKAVKENAMNVKKEEYGEFDLIIFAGLLYHLRYPFLAFRNMRELCRDGAQMIVETGTWVGSDRHAMLYCPAPADSPQQSRGGNSCSYFNRKGLCDTLECFGFRIEQCLQTEPSWRLTAKKAVHSLSPPFRPLSNTVVLCTRDHSLDSQDLQQFYEGTA